MQRRKQLLEAPRTKSSKSSSCTCSSIPILGAMASFKGFGKRLASTEASIRLEALHDLKAQLSTAVLDLTECMKLWKALFYCKTHLGMWMCDGKDNQTALAEELASIMDITPNPWLWATACFEMLRLQWDTLDRFRFDKFMHLARLYLRRTMALVTSSTLPQWTDLMYSFLDKATYKGQALAFHVFDIFAEERPKKAVKSTLRLIRPFLMYLKDVKLPHVAEAVYTRIFARFLGKEKYRDRLHAAVREMLADAPECESFKRSCGIQALYRCLGEDTEEKSPIKQTSQEEEIPEGLKTVMQKFYTAETKQGKREEKKRVRGRPGKAEKGEAVLGFEEVAVQLSERKHKGKEAKEKLQKKRKVMFNLKLNTTQRREHVDFGKDEVVSKKGDFHTPPRPAKGLLRSTPQ